MQLKFDLSSVTRSANDDHAPGLNDQGYLIPDCSEITQHTTSKECDALQLLLYVINMLSDLTRQFSRQVSSLQDTQLSLAHSNSLNQDSTYLPELGPQVQQVEFLVTSPTHEPEGINLLDPPEKALQEIRLIHVCN